MLLKHQVVLVTGAGRGIGAEIAKAAARCGARVVVNDLGSSLAGEGTNGFAAQGIVSEIIAAGGEAIANHADVSAADQAQAMVTEAIDRFGRLDVVVNNAGIVRDAIFHKMPYEDFDLVDSVNLRGVFYVSRAAAAQFKEQRSGCYVHMTSTSGLVGNLGQANYGAAKMGVAGLSKCIALDMSKFNVASNAVAPFAWTRMVAGVQETNENRKRLESARQMTPEKIAPLIVALASDMGRRITGQVFGVRNNELFLFSQPRPLRSIHNAAGWTPESIVKRAFPAFEPSLLPLEKSGDVFAWDPL